MIRFETSAGDLRDGALWDALAALSADDVAAFPALRPHQRMPVHAFFVQVSAIALRRAGRAAPPTEAAAWRDLLFALTPDWPNGEPWRLVVEDWSAPALLQPPVPDAKAKAEYKPKQRTPDALDMLVTAKNHDLKAERIAGGDDAWFFALVALQTAAGVMGAGNYGVSRMNGGYGSRVFMSIRPPGGPGAAFRRDLARLLAPELRAGMLHDTPGLAEDGRALLWTLPWSGAALAFDGLDPLYVDICRRIRLVRGGGVLTGWAAQSKNARIEAKALKGRTGDPWAPLDAKEPKSWGIGDGAFGYRKVATLLDPAQVLLPPLARLVESDAAEGVSLRLTAVRGGQGKTEGFHERLIPIGRVVRARGGAQRALDSLADAAQARAHLAGEVGRKLRFAVMKMNRRAGDDLSKPEVRKALAPKAERWSAEYDRRVDAVFFDGALQAQAAGEPGAHLADWFARLAAIARAVFAEAEAASPLSLSKSMRARAEGRAELDRGLATLAAQFKESADA